MTLCDIKIVMKQLYQKDFYLDFQSSSNIVIISESESLGFISLYQRKYHLTLSKNHGLFGSFQN